MSEVYSLVECKVTYSDGTSEMRRPTYSQISADLASVDHLSVIKYLRDNLTNVQSIEVIDTLYFKTKQDYENYLLR
ncbi:MAG: hypothetical protein ACERIH_04720 [Labilibaculum antarcticum]